MSAAYLLNLPASPFGRYEVVLNGSASIAGSRLIPPGFRYVRNDSVVTPIETGSDGAILMLLAFDDDACEGGLTGEGLSVAAAAAMERAI